ncbi:MAG: (2Fe-2S)-binding protein [Verrucomicrobia bacterium]|nr:(2Fe-2S)-binding protein [Verrucomicrobiota bacterium]
MKYTLNVNGQSRTVDVAPDTPLLWVLRDHLGLVGTKYGCGIGECGACMVHLDGAPQQSCMITVGGVGTAKITTIEGLAGPQGRLTPLQQAWCDLDVPQCGYCQAGQLMTAAALLQKHPKPTEAQIDEAMSDVLCRCGTYLRIREGIKRAAGLPSAGKETVQ